MKILFFFLLFLYFFSANSQSQIESPVTFQMNIRNNESNKNTNIQSLTIAVFANFDTANYYLISEEKYNRSFMLSISLDTTSSGFKITDKIKSTNLLSDTLSLSDKNIFNVYKAPLEFNINIEQTSNKIKFFSEIQYFVFSRKDKNIISGKYPLRFGFSKQ